MFAVTGERRRAARSAGRAALAPALAAAIGVVSAGLAAPGRALAAPGDACVSGFEGGQEAKKQGKLLKARAELRLCEGSCPELLAAECRGWLTEVQAQIGRARVSVRDEQGRPVDAAAVQIDGEPAAGAEVEVDPGAHVVAVAAQGYVSFRRDIQVAAGATVPVEVTLSRPPPQVPPAATWSRGPLALGLGAAGLASMLAGGALLVFGKVEEGRLAGTCSPMCDPGTVRVVEQAWIGGGVGLGAGALLSAAGLWLWLTAPEREPPRVTWRGWVSPDGAGGGVVVGGDL